MGKQKTQALMQAKEDKRVLFVGWSDAKFSSNILYRSLFIEGISLNLEATLGSPKCIKTTAVHRLGIVA